MKENDYISDILSGLGLAINEKNNNEIIINYPIILDKKIMEFVLNSNYKLINQTLGTFLSDFLNTNFEEILGSTYASIYFDEYNKNYIVSNNNGQYGIISNTGSIEKNLKYDKINSVSGGIYGLWINIENKR